MALPPVTAGMAFVFLVILAALTAFVTEIISPDTTAIGVLVVLAVAEPLTGVTASEAIAGFAGSATVTILAMYVLSAAVQETGLVERLGVVIGRVTGNSEARLLTATVGTTGTIAGVVNNTPVVAVFIPMVTSLADRAGVSPSRLLLPLSYAAMLGGTLTLLGTATNILAADLSRSLIGQSIGMFTLTPLGVILFLVGTAYLLTVGRWLTPARLAPDAPLVAAYDLSNHLWRLSVRRSSPFVGQTVVQVHETIAAAEGIDADLLLVEQPAPPGDPADAAGSASDEVGVAGFGGVETPDTAGAEERSASGVAAADEPRPVVRSANSDREISAGDTLVVAATTQDANRLAERFDLRQRPREEVTDADLAIDGRLVEALVLPDSRLVDTRVGEARLGSETTVLAIGRGDGEPRRSDLSDVRIRAGDTLLLRASEERVESLTESGDLVLTDAVRPHPSLAAVTEPTDDAAGELDDPERSAVSGASVEQNPKEQTDEPPSPDADGASGTESVDRLETTIAVGTLVGVIVLAALGWVPVVIAALGGVFVILASGTLTPSAAYDAVSWNVIFLLAGVLPLGLAMERTGGAAFLAAGVVATGELLPPIAVLGLFYLVTGVLAAIITPVATVVLLVPVAVDTAAGVGADPFAFVLAVTFASAAAFATPIGYQTNLMVYGPGGYRFTDYLRVGGPLQLLTTVVGTVGIALIYGL